MFFHKPRGVFSLITLYVCVGCNSKKEEGDEQLCKHTLSRFREMHCDVWKAVLENPVQGSVSDPVVGQMTHPNLKARFLYELISEGEMAYDRYDDEITDNVEELGDEALENTDYSFDEYVALGATARACVGLPEGAGGTPALQQELFYPQSLGAAFDAVGNAVCLNGLWEAMLTCNSDAQRQFESVCGIHPAAAGNVTPQDTDTHETEKSPPVTEPPPPTIADPFEGCADIVETISVPFADIQGLQNGLCVMFIAQEITAVAGNELDAASDDPTSWVHEKVSGIIGWGEEIIEDTGAWFSDWLSINEIQKQLALSTGHTDQSLTDVLIAQGKFTAQWGQKFVSKPLELLKELFIDPALHAVQVYLDPSADCWQRLLAGYEALNTVLLVVPAAKATKLLTGTKVTMTQGAQQAVLRNGIVVAVGAGVPTTRTLTVYSVSEMSSLLQGVSKEALASPQGMVVRKTSTMSALLTLQGSSLALSDDVLIAAWRKDPQILKAFQTLMKLEKPNDILQKITKMKIADILKELGAASEIECGAHNGAFGVIKVCDQNECVRLLWYSPSKTEKNYHIGMTYLVHVDRVKP